MYPENWLNIKNIDAKINNKNIFINFSLNINYHENTVILGPNGSGKTLLLHLISRNLYPIIKMNSEFKILGESNINLWHLRENIGFVLSEMDKRVKKSTKIKDLIKSGFNGTFNNQIPLNKNSKEDLTIERLLNHLGLKNVENDVYNKQSDGIKRLSLLGRALVYNPKILVLDEPFINLDIRANVILQNVLNNLCLKGLTILYVTHSIDSIIDQANRIIFMKEGKIIKDGKPSELLNSYEISKLYDIDLIVRKSGRQWMISPNY